LIQTDGADEVDITEKQLQHLVDQLNELVDDGEETNDLFFLDSGYGGFRLMKMEDGKSVNVSSENVHATKLYVWICDYMLNIKCVCENNKKQAELMVTV
jgi:hypothetical protein